MSAQKIDSQKKTYGFVTDRLNMGSNSFDDCIPFIIGQALLVALGYGVVDGAQLKGNLRCEGTVDDEVFLPVPRDLW